MTEVRCCNKDCNKIVGEIEIGIARFKCKSCGTFTVIKIEILQPAPRLTTTFEMKRDSMSHKSRSARM